MKKSIFLISLSVIIIGSCGSNTEVVYSYNNIKIKRFDSNGKTIFYYNEKSDISPQICVEYSGINDGFSGYLKFDDNGKVTLLSGDGYFITSNTDITKFEYKRISAYERPLISENIYFIQNAIRYEKEKNENTNTKVIVIYSDND